MINWRFCKTRGRTGDGYHKREAHDKSGRLNWYGDRLGLTAFASLFAKPTFLGVKAIGFTTAVECYFVTRAGEREIGIKSGRHTPKAEDLTGLNMGFSAFVRLCHSIFAKLTFLGVVVIGLNTVTREAHRHACTRVSVLMIIKR